VRPSASKSARRAVAIEALTCTQESSFLRAIARVAKGSCATARDRR
jgi:hypothetical protein